MKKVLFATTALVMSAGVAAADVSVGGDGRMGLTSYDGTNNGDLTFESRIRISFSASGETDSGLAFGGSIRADNAGAGASGTAGSVFVEGTFGKISMGDVSGAPEAAVGDLSGVGLTGVGDFNEMAYLSNNNDISDLADNGVDDDPDSEGAREAVRWDYTTGDLGIHISANQIAGLADTYGIALTYAMGDISFGIGHEDTSGPGLEADHTIVGVTAGFGDATVKAIYGTADIAGVDADQYGISVDYVTGATTVTGFYRTTDVNTAETDAFGVGVAYDLGGGASLKAGWANADTAGVDVTNYDFGISMSF